MLTKVITGIFSSALIITALSSAGCASDNMKSMDDGMKKEDSMMHDSMKDEGMKKDKMMDDGMMKDDKMM